MKIIKWFFKSTPVKIFFIFWFSSLFIGLVYAVGLIFPATPAFLATNGSFATRFTNIVGSCASGTFLKGFDASYNRICVGSDGLYAGIISSLPISTSSPGNISYPTGTPAGQVSGGKFTKYFENLYGLCPGNQIIKGFASDGFKYCVDPLIPTVYTPHTAILPNSTNLPPPPAGQSTGGKFQDFFTAMSQTCNGVQVANGFNTNGSPSCVSLPNSCAIIPTTGTIPNLGIPTIGTPSSFNQTWTYSATPGNCTFTCATNYIWNGTSCILNNPTCNASTPGAITNYSCPSGTLNTVTHMCEYPAVVGVGIVSTSMTPPSTPYTWRQGGGFTTGTIYTPSVCTGTRVDTWSMSCDNVCSYKGGGNCVYPKVYSCTDPSYPNPSADQTTCLPLAVAPAPTAAIASYTCNGSCNNTVALGCTSGSPINDGGQMACGTTRTWNCSGQGVNAVDSGQCSLANASCTLPCGTHPSGTTWNEAQGTCWWWIKYSCTNGTTSNIDHLYVSNSCHD